MIYLLGSVWFSSVTIVLLFNQWHWNCCGIHSIHNTVYIYIRGLVNTLRFTSKDIIISVFHIGIFKLRLYYYIECVTWRFRFLYRIIYGISLFIDYWNPMENNCFCYLPLSLSLSLLNTRTHFISLCLCLCYLKSYFRNQQYFG